MDLESECSALESVEDNEAITTIEKLDSVNDSDKVESNGKVVEITDVPSPDTAIKGFGLRKWRRIKREVTNEGVETIENTKLLKRGLSNGVAQSGKLIHDQMSEGSVSISSTNAIGKGIKVGPGGTDSESSKSSTAASVPKTGYVGPTSGKNLGIENEKVEIEMSKKPKGGKVKIEKENSHSSVESDSRSSNFVFMQGNYSATSNGKTYDEAQGIEELEPGYGRKINGDFEDDSYGNSAQGCSIDQDPLLESIQSFQSVQEAFEREVQKFKEIGIEDSIQENEEQSYLEELHLTEIINLKEKANFLEIKLDEITGILKDKQTKVLELESMLDKMDLHTENHNHMEMELELETLFKQKIEAEVEYLTISRMLQNVDQISVLEEQRKLATEQSRIVEKIVEKLEDAEEKSVKVKKEADELDIESIDETLKLQSNVCKYTSCFFIQLMLLILMILLVFSQFSPRSVEVVPT